MDLNMDHGVVSFVLVCSMAMVVNFLWMVY